MFLFFFFNDTATTEIYTLSLHDALPILSPSRCERFMPKRRSSTARSLRLIEPGRGHFSICKTRSEEHTSELQSQSNLVCRLLLEKKKKHERNWLDVDTGLPVHLRPDSVH